MCSRTYYLIIGHLVCHLSLCQGGKVRSNFSFILPYKHVWTLSYIYRVLISPIDKSSEQRNNKTKPKHNNFPCCEQWLHHGEPEDGKILFLAMSRRGHAMLWLGPSLRRRPTACPDMHDFTHFSRNLTKTKENSYTLQKNISQVCSNSTNTNHRDQLGFFFFFPNPKSNTCKLG